jgi:2-oxoglutarate ferredoxin oxidoreductase subunit alpha
MESVEFPETYMEASTPEGKDWALTGAHDRKPRIVKSLFLDPEQLEENCLLLEEKYKKIKANEVRYELYKVTDKTRILIVAYGTMARICQTAIDELEEENIAVGLFRPVTLFPYPEKELYAEASKKNIEQILTVEMSTGQMIEDVERVVKGARPIDFYGRTGGIVPSPNEIKDKIRKMLGGSK